MAYVQRFGLSRRSPLNAFGEPSKKKEEENPATDIIEKENKKSEEQGYNWTDGVTDALTVAGMIPGLGIVPDAINTVFNLGGAGVAALTGGNASKYLGNAALAGGAMIPGIGQGVSGVKLAAKLAPKTVKTVKGLDAGSKVLKAGQVAKKVKKAKGAGIIGRSLLSTSDYDPRNQEPIVM